MRGIAAIEQHQRARRRIAQRIRGVTNAAKQMRAEERFGKTSSRVSARSVPRAPAVVIMKPCNGMIATHRAAGVCRFIEASEDVDIGARIGLEAVPFIRAHPALRQKARGRVLEIFHKHRRFLNRGMVAEIRSDQSTVPRPRVFRVARRVNAHVAATAADVILESSLLRGIQHVARGGQKNHRRKLRQVRLGEVSRVFRGDDFEVVVRAELANGGNAIRDGSVAKSGRLGKHQHLEWSTGRGASAESEQAQRK